MISRACGNPEQMIPGGKELCQYLPKSRLVCRLVPVLRMICWIHSSVWSRRTWQTESLTAYKTERKIIRPVLQMWTVIHKYTRKKVKSTLLFRWNVLKILYSWSQDILDFNHIYYISKGLSILSKKVMDSCFQWCVKRICSKSILKNCISPCLATKKAFFKNLFVKSFRLGTIENWKGHSEKRANFYR